MLEARWDERLGVAPVASRCHRKFQVGWAPKIWSLERPAPCSAVSGPSGCIEKREQRADEWIKTV